MFAGNFAPRGWAFCDGQLLPISSNSALFSLLGTIYGGDGRTTFALPDLRGRVAIHEGNGPGLSPYNLGQRGGQETVTLTTSQMPNHTHAHQVRLGAGVGDQSIGVNNALAANASGETIFTTNAPNANSPLNPDSLVIGNAGGGQAHTNMQPFLAINFCIALQGLFPSRS